MPVCVCVSCVFCCDTLLLAAVARWAFVGLGLPSGRGPLYWAAWRCSVLSWIRVGAPARQVQCPGWGPRVRGLSVCVLVSMCFLSVLLSARVRGVSGGVARPAGLRHCMYFLCCVCAVFSSVVCPLASGWVGLGYWFFSTCSTQGFGTCCRHMLGHMSCTRRAHQVCALSLSQLFGRRTISIIVSICSPYLLGLLGVTSYDWAPRAFLLHGGALSAVARLSLA